MHLLKLPSGRYLNLEFVKSILPVAEKGCVEVWFAGDDTPSRYEGDDAAAILAVADRASD
jgi:hypothetical protein